MSRASHLQVIVTVGVLPPSEAREGFWEPALTGVPLLTVAAGDIVVLGVVGFAAFS
jgi:hypothetical protein